MKKEDIITLPDPRLRQRSKRVSNIDYSTQRLIEDMTSASLDWENSRQHEISAALAAVQLGVHERVVIVRSDFDDKENQDFTALINPEIVKYEGEEVADYEGCLSVSNGIYGLVKRASKIRVRATNIHGEEVRFKAEGFLARVIQHEVDHTKGVVFIDHIRDNPQAFYHLEPNGELVPLDFQANIEHNDELWSND